MPNPNKPIRLSNHARDQMIFRGASEEDVFKTIREAVWDPAELGRLQCRKDFSFDQIWNGKHYKTKQVKPVFAEEPTAIVIITVYVYYF